MTYPLGVDVGTTYTAAALWLGGRVQTVPLGNRANAVPSVVFLRDDGTVLVGEAAVPRGIGDPDRQAREFKRRMGDEVPILLGGEGFTAHELIGRVLRWTVDKVAELQGSRPGHVVMTHPAEWGAHRCGLLAQAARSTGLRNVGLLAEPVAAATWYAAQQRVEPGSLIGIYDFGGGTFDASVVRKTGTGVELFGEPGGDDRIGGVDFDHALLRHVIERAGADPSALDFDDPEIAAPLGQLLSSVVDAKEALSADVEAVVPVMVPGLRSQVLVRRAEFEDLIRPRVQGTVGVFGRVVRRAGTDPGSLRAVLLVGGTSRIPLVRELLAADLGVRATVDAHPKYTVCLGAAIAAAPRSKAPFARTPPGAPLPVAAPPPPRDATPPGARSQPLRPIVAKDVDLVTTGLTAAIDSPAPSVSHAEPPGEHEEPAAAAAERRRRAPVLWTGVAVLVAVALAGVFLLFRGPGGTDPADRPGAVDTTTPATTPVDPTTRKPGEPPPPPPPPPAPEITSFDIAFARGDCGGGQTRYTLSWTSTEAETAALGMENSKPHGVPVTEEAMAVCAHGGATFTLEVVGPGGTDTASVTAPRPPTPIPPTVTASP